MRALVVVLTFALAGRAHAQRAEAQDAFERGRKLMKDGDYPAACAAFETSFKLEPATGTLYNLGLCHEKQGRIASAWAEHKQVSETDTNKGRAADALKRVEALEPRLTRMKIVVTDPVPGLAIERNGIDVTTFIDQPVPVDPRTYKFTVTAPGHQSLNFERTLDSEGKTVEVAIPKFGTVVTPDPVRSVTPAGYPTQLALRPIAMPNGVAEVTAINVASTSDAFAQTPIDGAAFLRYGIQQFELGLRARFHERYAVLDNRPNPLLEVGGSLVYSITPMFAGRLEYARRHPFGRLGSDTDGSDLRVELARKQLLAPRIAIDGTAGFLFLQRTNAGFSANELIGDTRVALQLTATPRLSFEGAALFQLNLGGALLSHTVTLAVAPTAVFVVTPQIDVFARILVGLLPAASGSSSSDFRSYTIGLNWRP